MTAGWGWVWVTQNLSTCDAIVGQTQRTIGLGLGFKTQAWPTRPNRSAGQRTLRCAQPRDRQGVRALADPELRCRS